MSCALRVNAATQVKINVHLLRRGAAKRGWSFIAPSLFAAWLAVPFYLACLSLWVTRNLPFVTCSLRYFAAIQDDHHECSLLGLC